MYSQSNCGFISLVLANQIVRGCRPVSKQKGGKIDCCRVQLAHLDQTLCSYHNTNLRNKAWRRVVVIVGGCGMHCICVAVDIGDSCLLLAFRNIRGKLFKQLQLPVQSTDTLSSKNCEPLSQKNCQICVKPVKHPAFLSTCGKKWYLLFIGITKASVILNPNCQATAEK